MHHNPALLIILAKDQDFITFRNLSENLSETLTKKSVFLRKRYSPITKSSKVYLPFKIFSVWH